jgi:hypothetical protein
MANKTWVGSISGDYGVAGNWSPAAVPIAGDDVDIPASSTQPITLSLNQSGVNLNSFTVEKGAPPIGSAAGYLQIHTASFTFMGSALSYIDLSSSAINAEIDNTFQSSSGAIGLYLKGSALNNVAISSGNVGIAALFGETASATSVRITGKGANVVLGAGVTNSLVECSAGSTTVYCASGQILVYGGSVATAGSGAISDFEVYGGAAYPESSGTVGNMICAGGKTDTTGSGIPRTISAIQLNPGAEFRYDPNVVSISTWGAPTQPVKITVGSP